MNQGNSPKDQKSVYLRSISNGQIQLPAPLVSEIGYPGDTLVYQGPEVMWYHHVASGQAVLSNKQVNQAGLKQIRSTKITGVSEKELQNDESNGGRITVPTDLPEKVHDAISADEEVVLEPLYEERQSELSSTCVIVRPALEFYREFLSPDKRDPFPTPLNPDFDESEVTMDLSNVDILPSNENHSGKGYKVR